ncbi:MAG: prepilin-type N-terminal cleavage/methylation domain-containing protein [Verrucomicrobiae bacterium]|nr:prepilin-type N-terminal cleavage/methylation domain-containing protein [Verrucomicrobiae bacterium]
MVHPLGDNCRRRPGGCSRDAYSLIELLLVISVLAVVMGMVVASLGSLRSTSLSTATRQFADFLNLCRSQAIARHTAVRVGIVEQGENPDDQYRRYSAWAWNKRSREFEQVEGWKRLPMDLVFAPRLPPEVKASSYAERDASAVRGDYWFDRGGSRPSENADTIRFVEFSPAGRASLKDGDLRNVVLVMRGGEAGSVERSTNWSQFNIDTLTGRVRVYRP